MNTSLLCLLAAAAASPTAAPRMTVYRPVSAFEIAMRKDDVPPVVVRAQSSPILEAGTASPLTYATGDGYPVHASPPTAYTGTSLMGTVSPFDGTATPVYQTYQQPLDGGYQTYQQPLEGGISGDPWIAGGQGGGLQFPGANPYAGANPGLYTLGFNGAQPYRYGWSARYDVGILPSEGTTGAFSGGWGITEVDVEKELVTPIWNNYVFAIAPQFDYRSWEGPSFGGGLPGLHSNMYRFGLGLKLATPDYGGWNAEVGFNPAYASDLDNTEFSDAMQWDGHAVVFWRMTPSWMWAFGAAYWDRVDDIIIPNAGFVWTPNDTWEFRLVFPKPRISMYLGTPFAVPTWLYVRGEYHVESYAVQLEPTVGTDMQIQIEDWRVLAGLRSETGAVTTFAEVGWVFERESKFDVPGLNSQINSGLIGRVGLRY